MWSEFPGETRSWDEFGGGSDRLGKARYLLGTPGSLNPIQMKSPKSLLMRETIKSRDISASF